MADDITKLGFEIEQRGAAKVEKSLRDIEDGVSSALSMYKKFSLDGKKSSEDMTKHIGGIQESLGHVERSIASASKEYGGMFHSGQMKRQQRRIQQIRKEMDGLNNVIAHGSGEQKKMAMERMKTLKEAADVEMKSTTKVFKAHQKEFDRLVSMKKKSLGELSQEAAKGSATAIQQLMRGDVKGLAQTAGGGIRGAGEQAQKMAFDRDMRAKKAGGAGAGAAQSAELTKLLKGFAKAAGPIALIAGSVAMLVKLFLDMDARVKEVNKNMLENVSLVNLASASYGSFENRLAGAELALRDFRDVAMRDMELRMLGMDPDEMGKVMGALTEQSNLLENMTREGVGFKDALKTAQVAALNLGVDASETAGLIGTLADVTSVGFKEAAESLTTIVAFSREAGVSTQRFFNTVQSVVGEMGLYNYRIEETAALFTRLSNIMDSESAEGFVKELSTAFKNASALERTTTVVVNGLGRVAEMADRTQERLQKGLNPDDMMKAFQAIGKKELFEEAGLEGAVEKLTRSQRNALQSALRTNTEIDDQTASQFEQYRRMLEANRGSVKDMQGVLSDFALGDQISLQIGELEGKLRMPIENMNSVLAESQGVSEDQLRMLQIFKGDMEGELTRLQQAAESGEDDFNALAKELGYSMDLDEFRNKEMSNWTDLLEVMTSEKQDEMTDELEKQTTAAERTAEFQRTLLDTLKYTLLDYVQKIYEILLNVYDGILSLPGARTSERQRVLDEARARAQAMQRRKEIEQGMARATEDGDEEAFERFREEKKQIELEIQAQTSGTTAYQDRVVRERHHKGRAGELAQRSMQERDVDFYDADGDRINTSILNEERLQQMIESGLVAEFEIDGQRTDLSQYFDDLYDQRRADFALRKEAIELQREGVATEEEMVERLRETKAQLLEDTDLSPETIDDMARKNARHYVEMMRREDLMTAMAAGEGITREEAARHIDFANAGDIPGASTSQQASRDLVRQYSMPSARDARIVTGGVPMLDLQAGDIIVDQDALAQTMAGGRGDYVPRLLNQAGGKIQGGGGGGGNVMHAIFNIYGDQRDIRNTILKAIQEWERQRSMR